MNSITNDLLNSSIDNAQNGFLNTKQGVLNTGNDLLNTNERDAEIQNDSIGFVKALGRGRFILSAINESELSLTRIEDADFVTSLGRVAEHISSAINPKRDELERIMSAVQKRLLALS
jgi:hypothetical protein